MVKQDLDALIERAYAVLGKSRPSEAVKNVVFENCARIDADALEFLKTKINNLDFMPPNLSKALWAWFGEWRRMNGRGERFGCKTCGGYSGFWVLRRQKGTDLYGYAFSPCPHCNADFYGNGETPPDKDEIERSGGIVMPLGRHRECVRAFALEKGYRLAW